MSLAHRPVIACGFGSYVDPEGFALARQAFAGDERTLLQVMDERDLGFVVSGAASYLKEKVDGQALLIRDAAGQGVPNAHFLGARPNATLALGGSSTASTQVPHLQHLMPIGASTDTVQPLAWALPVVWVYERVEGANVNGQATAGSIVEAHLEGRVGGRPYTWHAWTTAGADGRFSLRLPVPTSYQGHRLTTGAQWRIDGVAVALPEASVRGGVTVEVSKSAAP